MTPLLSNANPHLNAYIKCAAASLTENLYFDRMEACGYPWGSPKKLSKPAAGPHGCAFPQPGARNYRLSGGAGGRRAAGGVPGLAAATLP